MTAMEAAEAFARRHGKAGCRALRDALMAAQTFVVESGARGVDRPGVALGYLMALARLEETEAEVMLHLMEGSEPNADAPGSN